MDEKKHHDEKHDDVSQPTDAAQHADVEDAAIEDLPPTSDATDKVRGGPSGMAIGAGIRF